MWRSFLYLTITLLHCQAFPLLCHPVCCNCGGSIVQDAGYRPFLAGHIMVPVIHPQPKTIFIKLLRPMNRTTTRLIEKETAETTTARPLVELDNIEEKIITTPESLTSETREENIIYAPEKQPDEDKPFEESSPTPDQILTPEAVKAAQKILEAIDSEENKIFSKEPAHANSLDNFPTAKNSSPDSK